MQKEGGAILRQKKLGQPQNLKPISFKPAGVHPPLTKKKKKQSPPKEALYLLLSIDQSSLALSFPCHQPNRPRANLQTTTAAYSPFHLPDCNSLSLPLHSSPSSLYKCFPCMLHTTNTLTYFEFVFFKKNKYSKFKRKCVLAWIS